MSQNSLTNDFANALESLRLRWRTRLEEALYRTGLTYRAKKKVYLVSYPRSGNTLVRTYFAILQGRPQVSVYKGDVVATIQSARSRALDHVALIKSHSFDPDMQDVVYIVRDGRNAMISHLYLKFLWGDHQISRLEHIAEGLKYLTNDGHFWGDHVKTARSEAKRKNIAFVKYEDLVEDPAAVLQTIIHFMGGRVSRETLDCCVDLAKKERTYFERQGSGYTYEPPKDSIYHRLKQYRREEYWRKIFDLEARRYFHERGGTEWLLQFGYEHSAEWWLDESR